ncbi:MAG: hypothetical protein MUE46_01520 [Xanthomonadales bacterium]|jgi:hypothetical protein|nr:hypothetical protein [Xanthomonadales bacterium]
MWNLCIELPQRNGALADFGETLGAAGISLEGGGVFTLDGRAVANFLVADGEGAAAVLAAAGFGPCKVQPVLQPRLRQGTPGQLGRLARSMAAAGVGIEVQYSDHAHRLVLVVDDFEAGRAVSEAWGLSV